MNAENKMLDSAIEQITVGLRILYAFKGYMDCEQQKNAPKKGAFSYSGELDATSTKEQQSAVRCQPVIQIQEDEDLKNVYLRPDGRYMIRYQINGRRVVGYAHTLAQARAKLAQVKKKALQAERVKTSYTVASWIDYWIETYKKNFLKYDGYIELVRIMCPVKEKLGHIKLEKLTTANIQEFYNTFSISRKKEKIILYINACLTKAVQTQVIKYNPCLAVVKDKKQNNVRPPFTLEEQYRILEAVKGRDIEPYIYFYLLTGIRKNELPKNIMACIDDGRIKVINEKQRGNKLEYKYIDISPQYMQLLQLQIQSGKFNLSINQVYRKFADVLKKLNIKGGMHTLRHTFATNYYYLGIPEKVIQSWLGHKTLNITQDIYIGLNTKNPKEDLIKLYNNLLYQF